MKNKLIVEMAFLWGWSVERWVSFLNIATESDMVWRVLEEIFQCVTRIKDWKCELLLYTVWSTWRILACWIDHLTLPTLDSTSVDVTEPRLFILLDGIDNYENCIKNENILIDLNIERCFEWVLKKWFQKYTFNIAKIHFIWKNVNMHFLLTSIFLHI